MNLLSNRDTTRLSFPLIVHRLFLTFTLCTGCLFANNDSSTTATTETGSSESAITNENRSLFGKSQPRVVKNSPSPKIFYLLERVSAPIEGGLKGLPPGTRLRLINDSGVKWQLMDSTGTLVEVEPALLTLDEETAKAMLISDLKLRDAALAARAKAIKEAEAAMLAEREQHSKAVREAAIPEKAGLTGESRLLKPAK